MSAFAIRQHPGDTVGYGAALAWNTGDETVVLERANLIDPTPGLDIVETLVAPPTRSRTGLAYSETWPSDEYADLRPVAGLRVAPRSTPDGKGGAMFVFALRLPKLGDYQHGGVEVHYTVGGREYVTQIRTSLRICVVAASEDLRGPCASPDAFGG